MRYYLYISDAKVDMLFPQVPGATQRNVAKRLGFDLKLLSGSVETQQDTFNSRIARLNAVEAHLRSLGGIGSATDSTPWLNGQLEAQFFDYPDVILFLAYGERHIVALTGSPQHMIGSTQEGPVHISSSLGFALRARMPELFEESSLELLESHAPDELSVNEVRIDPRVSEQLDRHRSRASRHPPQCIDFLAKRLMTERRGRFGQVTIASPLYVALAE